MPIRIRGTAYLICRTCGSEHRIDGTEIVDTLPIIEWWYRTRTEQCVECFTAELSDPTENHAYQMRNAKQTAMTAARRAYPRTGTHRMRVLRHTYTTGDGSTDDETIIATGMAHTSVSPRRLELVEGGWLEDSGERRKTRTGTFAIVWQVTPRAKAKLEAQVA